MQDSNEIIQNLYLGNETSSKIYNDIDIIINCSKDLPFTKKCLGIRIPIDDSPEESSRLFKFLKTNKVLDIMHNFLGNNKKVLVHCRMGMQRSCTVVACYLIKYYNFTPQQAVAFIKNKRHIAFFGNVNFYRTLIWVHKYKI
jgi:protein-tyrosine phosphatase